MHHGHACYHWACWFRNEATYRMSKTNVESICDGPLISPNLVWFGPLSSKNNGYICKYVTPFTLVITPKRFNISKCLLHRRQRGGKLISPDVEKNRLKGPVTRALRLGCNLRTTSRKPHRKGSQIHRATRRGGCEQVSRSKSVENKFLNMFSHMWSYDQDATYERPVQSQKIADKSRN